MIPAELEAELYKKEPMRSILGSGPMRPRAYEELNGEIRGVFIDDLTSSSTANKTQSKKSVSDKTKKAEL